MPFQGDELYRTKDQILAAYIAAWQAAVPDVYVGEDGTLYLVMEIDAAQVEGLYLSNQLVLEDMFIQTASYSALQRHGESLGLDQTIGSPATGNLIFAGQGGVYIPTGTEVAFDPGGGQDVLYYTTTVAGTIPNPGIPTAPTVADSGSAGNLTGTFEWAVTFITDAGETLAGAVSDALTLSGHSANLTNIPVGGPGTTQRKIYRSLNGGVFQLVNTITDNTTTTWTDDVLTPGPSTPPTISGAQQITLAAQSEDNGVVYNAVAGAITILSAVPDGITSVTNPSAFTGGADTEDIEHYRTRLLNWLRNPQTGSTGDLVAWAETVSGVDSATAFNNQDESGASAPGTVTIRIAGPGGAIPDPSVVSAVQTLLDSYNLANITILVTTFTADPIDVTVTIYPEANYTTAQLTPSVQAAIETYINSVPVGGTLYLSGIIDAVFPLPGVLDVVVTLPATNQTAPATSKFTPGTITVNGTP